MDGPSAGGTQRSLSRLQQLADEAKRAIDMRLSRLASRCHALEAARAAWSAQHPRLPVERRATLRLDIGGRKFNTTHAALTGKPGFFRVLAEGFAPFERDQEGCIFIDRSSLAFQYVLNHLSGHALQLDALSPVELDALILDAVFYELEDLQRELGIAHRRNSLMPQEVADAVQHVQQEQHQQHQQEQEQRAATTPVRDANNPLFLWEAHAASMEQQIKAQEVEFVEYCDSVERLVAKIASCVSSEKIVIVVQQAERRFATTLRTLSSQEGPLKQKFSNKALWMADMDAEGCVFVDANADSFEHILNLLRGYPAPAHLPPSVEACLRHDLDYFGGLEFERHAHPSNMLRTLQDSGSCILTHVDQLRRLQVWLAPVGTLGGLRYRATRDGKTPADFHRLCDDLPASLVLVRAGTNIFGGFSSVSWKSPEEEGECYVEAPGSFIFTLVNSHNLPAEKFDCTKPEYAIYCGADFGPAFGLGRDLVLWYYSTKPCISNFPQSYGPDSTGKGCTLFAGTKVFIFDEVEVFEVILG